MFIRKNIEICEVKLDHLLVSLPSNYRLNVKKNFQFPNGFLQQKSSSYTNIECDPPTSLNEENCKNNYLFHEIGKRNESIADHVKLTQLCKHLRALQ